MSNRTANRVKSAGTKSADSSAKSGSTKSSGSKSTGRKTSGAKKGATSAKSVRLHFTYERDTKNKVRFSEDGDQQAVGTLYLDQGVYANIGNGSEKHLTVDISVS